MLTKYQKISARIVLMAACVSVGGCVRPGEVDQRIISRYQRAMAERGPGRRGEAGLNPYRPDDTICPRLKLVRDEKNGTVRVLLSLQDAVMRALANSPDIRVVSFDPAISREEMVKAAAEFDYIVFGGLEIERKDEQTKSPFTAGKSYQRKWEAGLKQKTITGATWGVDWSLSHNFDPAVSGFRAMQRSYDNRMTLRLTQPLLRDAWPEFNLARVRVARLDYKANIAAFRQNVEETITEVISLYWGLIQARRERLIQQALLGRTIETYERIKQRVLVDATDVEVKQSEAAVETRTADLIRTEKTIVDVQDRLIRQMTDKQLNVLSDYEIVPTTRMNTEEVRVDVTDQLLTALRHNPVLERLRLAVAITGIAVRVAENQTLPRLDVTASSTVQGLGPAAHEAKENLGTLENVGYSVGITFEYPLGNRERIADLRRRKAERLKAIATLQNVGDQVAVQLRERIRQIETTYRELKAQRRAVAANLKELEAIQATEELRRLSPEFLQVKLSSQERLAQSERAELRAMVDYNSALVELARATGTVLELNRVQIAIPPILGEGDWPTEPSDEQLPGRPYPPRTRPGEEL